MAKEARTDKLKAQNHAACLNGASVITAVIATHDKGDDATSEDFEFDMTHDEKKARVSRSMGYLVDMMARDDWGSEDMTKIKAAISAGTTFVG
tara:strand:- start:1475 stop:1753 length:279 start_codon:yes stop_codon:yes gene_type:complete